MNVTTPQWDQFVPGVWTTEVDVRDFIQKNYTPYTGDDSFLAQATSRTTALWEEVCKLTKEETKKGILDVETKIPASVISHGPGYINKELETIVGLQTDAPLKRGIMPKGGIRVIQNAMKTFNYELDPQVAETYTNHRKTHNDGVFDVYTDDMRAARKTGIITGLPDAYGRGRIIGDYRRVALYGVDFLIEVKKQEVKQEDTPVLSDESIRLREELAEQIRALADLKTMAQSYGFDISGPAKNAQEAIQWTYFAYLASTKQQDGAATSLGRVATFLDIYIERDLKAGVITEEEVQELMDHFAMKLRMVRFLRTP